LVDFGTSPVKKRQEKPAGGHNGGAGSTKRKLKRGRKNSWQTGKKGQSPAQHKGGNDYNRGWFVAKEWGPTVKKKKDKGVDGRKKQGDNALTKGGGER